MENPLRKQIRSIMKDHKKRQMWYRIVTTLAVVVVFVTTYMLILPAITMENKAECGITEHKHDANCYSSHYEKEKELACTTDSLGVHKHTDACYDAEHKLICGYADFVIHEHDASCYDKDGNLVCTIPEHKLHQHTPECYQMQKQLVCTQEESVVFENLKAISSVKAKSKITVEYTSLLNENAILGKPGNVNEAKLEFSNNPNNDQIGNPETGETPWDNVIVFTYQVVVNKYANSVAAGNKLPGAEFKLEKVLKDGTKKAIAVVKSSDETSFTFKGLDDGDYILTETKTPAQYNTIAPITFTVTAEHNIEWTTGNRNDILTSLTGDAASGTITFSPKTDDNNVQTGLETNVINKSGSTLPTTGGMGTTIFYVVGSILVLGAAILLITKKRMSAR